jgi:hypothetical protein
LGNAGTEEFQNDSWHPSNIAYSASSRPARLLYTHTYYSCLVTNEARLLKTAFTHVAVPAHPSLTSASHVPPLHIIARRSILYHVPCTYVVPRARTSHFHYPDHVRSSVPILRRTYGRYALGWANLRHWHESGRVMFLCVDM